MVPTLWLPTKYDSPLCESYRSYKTERKSNIQRIHVPTEWENHAEEFTERQSALRPKIEYVTDLQTPQESTERNILDKLGWLKSIFTGVFSTTHAVPLQINRENLRNSLPDHHDLVPRLYSVAADGYHNAPFRVAHCCGCEFRYRTRSIKARSPLREFLLAGGSLMIIRGFINIANISQVVIHPTSFILETFEFIFGIIMLVIEAGASLCGTPAQDILNRCCYILTFPLGKALLYLLAGAINVSLGSVIDILIGAYILMLGVILIVQQKETDGFTSFV